ncbi:Copper amine oxidase N-terminal domain-containing protein [Acetoanaerobium noterae]|uniref:Copper amine oxidase N-terminal domain-containing protein n=1 Tax=Acetoanaerobium noterae TaxID=745369 RepID=A0A1T5AZK1_9FIRM|nr:stalk domain-containing protein [Acetoanaerobium noterae]SKB40227.1 Copper amine oxidase N-terminal domain-containing protein [Acetoanaerobium noterae]
MKKILAITLTMLIGISSFAYAAPKTIEAYLQNDFLIKVNGEFKYHPEGLKPIVYENRTYLPAAFIADILGASTTFDTSTKTVNIASQPQNSLDQNKIDEYENKIKELENKIKKLESSTQVTSDYANFPSRVSKDGYQLTVEGLSVRDDGRDGRLYFYLKNEDVNTGIKINSMATTIEANGKTYKASAMMQENLDMKLFKWVQRTEDLKTFIPFSDLPEEDKDIKEMTITIEVEINQAYPKTETLVFKVLND